MFNNKFITKQKTKINPGIQFFIIATFKLIISLLQFTCLKLKVYESRHIAYLGTSGSERETTK